MDQIKKTYRMFVSSCSKLLTEERKKLINLILKKGHLPVGMEYDFGGSNTMLSLSIDKEKIENSDCVIFILSYLYGEIIDKKIGKKKEKECPFSVKAKAVEDFPHENCDSCFSSTCHISFTHFEYLYAIEIGKPVYVIINSNYDNQEAFENANKSWKSAGGNDCLVMWGQGREKNKKFIDSTGISHRYAYCNQNDFEKVCSEVLDVAIVNLQKPEYDAFGLVPFSTKMQVPNEGIFKPITFFNQDTRPESTTLFETIKDTKKFHFMARTGVTFLSRYSQTIQRAINNGCECRFLILNKDSHMIKNGRYETAFDQQNAEMSYVYLKRLKDDNPDKVQIHLTDFYPTFDIEYFEKKDGRQIIVVQSHFLISHLGPERPMFMLDGSDFWFQIFKDEIDEMWNNTSEWSGSI